LCELNFSENEFDLVHHLMPAAPRYTFPDIVSARPVVIGPLSGSLAIPSALGTETTSDQWFSRARDLDRFRFRYDPLLRQSYRKANAVLLAAPYMYDVIEPLISSKPYIYLPWANEGKLQTTKRHSIAQKLVLLHVGRAVRTKGLRETIRALAKTKDLPNISLISAGTGPDLERCKAEARELGVSEQISFLGHVRRSEIDELYRKADVFCFPSYREPIGHVVFEAMAMGLPIITAAHGGPEYITNDDCSIRIRPDGRDVFQQGISRAIRKLYFDLDKRTEMSKASLIRAQSFGTWNQKAAELAGIYESVLRPSTSHRSSQL
ncbi:MAG: glycosyltransferase family 4 protein, partial [Litoreibacter sp.]